LRRGGFPRRSFCATQGAQTAIRPAQSTFATVKKLDQASPERRIEHEDEMFAVIKTGGKQYRVAADDVINVDKVKGDVGEIIQFGEVLVVGGDSVTLGAPMVAGASVAGEVIEQGRGATIIAFKKRRRQNSRRKRGQRQEFTRVRITEILTEGAKPSKGPRPKPERKPKAEMPAGTEADETTAKKAAPKAKAKAKPAAKAKAKPPAKPNTSAAKAPAKRRDKK
jgi:large subunit ribosomal protein L21